MPAPPRYHLLLVDDSRLWLTMLRVYLAPFDVHVHEALSGTWALQSLGTVIPDAVIADYNLDAKMNGVQLVRAIRAHATPAVAAVPVMMFTGDERARSEALGAGANVFAMKPIEPKPFVAALEHMLPRIREATLGGLRASR